MSAQGGWITPMRGRDPRESHRASTPLELFFDLVIVVAIAAGAGSLHHGISGDHVLEAVLGYVMTFFAIWWAWMAFTWFGTAYDTDDVPYRVAVFVEMAGAIIMAAGIGRAFDDNDWALVLLGYIVMRLALVVLWLRAALDDRPKRTLNLRFAAGIAIMQVLWVIAFMVVPGALFPVAFFSLVAGELAIPLVAYRGQPGALFHAEHIAERYGLLTIIVLGESMGTTSSGPRMARSAPGSRSVSMSSPTTRRSTCPSPARPWRSPLRSTSPECGCCTICHGRCRDFARA
jgi:low temperature requirement protein LtrA